MIHLPGGKIVVCFRCGLLLDHMASLVPARSSARDLLTYSGTPKNSAWTASSRGLSARTEKPLLKDYFRVAMNHSRSGTRAFFFGGPLSDPLTAVP
jgi:hypothetical protein